MKPALILDPEDVDRVALRCWVLGHRGSPVSRVRRGPERKAVYLHHYIVGCPLRGYVVDHINGDKLDNRKENLRICRQGENSRNQKRHRNNTSGQAGVRQYGRRGRWLACLMLSRKAIHLGCFDTFAEAREARLAGEIRYFGAFAPSLSRKESA